VDESLRDAWERHAQAWAAWARRPGFDAYWRFGREAFFAVVPPPGRLTLDVGCGEGRVARDLAARGHRVRGVDGSETLVALARAASPEIDFAVADAAALPFAAGEADLVVAHMSLQDVDDLDGAVREAARVLEPGGRLCAAIVHPLNSAGVFTSHGGASPFVIEGSYLEPRRYEEVMERDGLTMTFASEHRTLEAYSRALEAAGFAIEMIREPAVPEGVWPAERVARWRRVPMFLYLRAVLATA
jgi:SAM-dependent methyltransferase